MSAGLPPMSYDYTPTTEQVRAGFSRGGLFEFEEIRNARFDRWFAAHDRQVAAKAWDEGYWLGINGHTGPGNPYREKPFPPSHLDAVIA